MSRIGKKATTRMKNPRVARERDPLTSPDPQKTESTEITDNLAGLVTLEQRVFRGSRNAAAALRMIREQRLYRHRDFNTFDAYVEVAWRRTRQWATTEIGWLRVLEIFEERTTGKESYQDWANLIPRDWARFLKKLVHDPEELVRAYDEICEEKRQTGKMDGSRVQAIVKRRQAYDKAKTTGWARGLDSELQLKEYICLDQLRFAARRVESHPYPVREALKVNPSTDSLIEACKQHQRLPEPKTLIRYFRCEALERAILPLLGLALEWDHADTAVTKTAEAQAEMARVLRIFRQEPDGPRLVEAPIAGVEPIAGEDEFRACAGRVFDAVYLAMHANFEAAVRDAKPYHVFHDLVRAQQYLASVAGPKPAAEAG